MAITPEQHITNDGVTKIQHSNEAVASFLNEMTENMPAEARGLMPTVTGDNIYSLHEYGKMVDTNDMARNAFHAGLFNLVWKVYGNNMYWRDPWVSITNKGELECGETAEEYYVDLAYVENYDSNDDPTNLLEYEKPDIRSTFHSINYQKRYIQTINKFEVRKAFLTFDGVYDLAMRIRDVMYTSASYDHFLTAKFLLARALCNGVFGIYGVGALDGTKEAVENVAVIIRKASNDLTFPDTEFNEAGVYNATSKEFQILIQDTEFNANMSVKVLASAFNISETQFMGQQLLTRGFNFTVAEKNRLERLMANDPNYVALTTAEEAELAKIYAVHLDRDWFFILDALWEFRTFENGYSLAENNYLHDWKVVDYSPFRNGLAYAPVAPVVTSVTVTPNTISMPKTAEVQFIATVVTSGFAKKSVVWSVSGNTASGTVVDTNGKLHISANETATTVTVTATSVFDPTKTGSATVTVLGNE